MSRNSIIRLIITLGVLIAISCSFANLSNLISPSAQQEAFVAITASQGGELTLPDKTVLNIPAGSLQNDTQVSIRKVADTGIPGVQEEMYKVGAAYQINLGTSGLVKPATLEIPFDSALLPKGSKPGQVFLSFYDEVAQKWVFAGGKVDTNRNVVVLQITHASLWMPATWNWAAWIAVLNKLGQVGIVNWIQAVQLLTTSCSQTGNYIKVDSGQELNMIQGCVEQDESQHPVLRIVNPKSFYYEIMPISGGNGYPADTMLAPGDDIKFTASTSDPSPLIIQAQITQKAGLFLVIHMVITMLPGLDQFGIQSSQVACLAQRLSDVSYFSSAAESLLVDHEGAAAAESISKFMLNADALQRFLTAAENCDVVPAPTWSFEGIEQIGGAVSTIMSSTDFIANYFAENSDAQVSFTWVSYKIGSTKTRPADGMVMVYVPEGKFSMGSDIGDPYNVEDDWTGEYQAAIKPMHLVFLDAYWIDKTDVTNAMYEKCVEDGACQLPDNTKSSTRNDYYNNSQYADYPVIYVNWTDANDYCNWAGARLPTEAQWEKAARGTDGRIFPWGNSLPTSCSQANLSLFTPNGFSQNVCVGDTSIVGAYPSGASPYGVLDMVGNVEMWVNDWYEINYYPNSPSSNPQGPSNGTRRVIRGSWWGTWQEGYLPVIIRKAEKTTFAYDFLGFRCSLRSP